VLSPVTHPLLPHLAAPGQLSFAESMSILYLTGLITPKKFYLFGHPIQHSMSPIMQNTAFATLGLPHTYELRETQKVDEIVEVLRSPSFGGASVTIPFKIDIIPMLQHISRQARIIGAVNTIIPVPEGLSGDNTDWRALKTCLLRSITPANGVTSTTTTLVLGAGGTTRATIYALYHIGVVNIVLFNRTKAKAQLLADEFNKLDPLLRIRVIDSLAVPLPIHPSPTMIISTVPGIPEGARVIKNGDAASGAQQGIDLGLTLDHFSPAGGVAIEWAYDPPVTKLISLARQKKDHGWITVEGIDLLLEQGYEQFQLWTGRRAPMAAVRRKVYESYASGVR
jgi:shikimate-5-dehydrogenase